MRLLLTAAAAALVLGSVPALAEPADSYKDADRATGLYDRIVAHYGPAGKNVRERFRDGPCSVKREWKKNGDYSESIRCRAPRR